ncbi:hypothetical protein [Brevundimonas sp.]|uniref:hypothetical protein n=1 Tax=Brevundimonas sp. TaxID=1871086 RepID=UPI003AFF9B6E
MALSIAFVLQYMASGARWVEERLAIRPYCLDRRGPGDRGAQRRRCRGCSAIRS